MEPQYWIWTRRKVGEGVDCGKGMISAISALLVCLRREESTPKEPM